MNNYRNNLNENRPSIKIYESEDFSEENFHTIDGYKNNNQTPLSGQSGQEIFSVNNLSPINNTNNQIHFDYQQLILSNKENQPKKIIFDQKQPHFQTYSDQDYIFNQKFNNEQINTESQSEYKESPKFNNEQIKTQYQQEYQEIKQINNENLNNLYHQDYHSNKLNNVYYNQEYKESQEDQLESQMNIQFNQSYSQKENVDTTRYRFHDSGPERLVLNKLQKTSEKRSPPKNKSNTRRISVEHYNKYNFLKPQNSEKTSDFGSINLNLNKRITSVDKNLIDRTTHTVSYNLNGKNLNKRMSINNNEYLDNNNYNNSEKIFSQNKKNDLNVLGLNQNINNHSNMRGSKIINKTIEKTIVIENGFPNDEDFRKIKSEKEDLERKNKALEILLKEKNVLIQNLQFQLTEKEMINTPKKNNAMNLRELLSSQKKQDDQSQQGDILKKLVEEKNSFENKFKETLTKNLILEKNIEELTKLREKLITENEKQKTNLLEKIKEINIVKEEIVNLQLINKRSEDMIVSLKNEITSKELMIGSFEEENERLKSEIISLRRRSLSETQQDMNSSVAIKKLTEANENLYNENFNLRSLIIELQNHIKLLEEEIKLEKSKYINNDKDGKENVLLMEKIEIIKKLEEDNIRLTHEINSVKKLFDFEDIKNNLENCDMERSDKSCEKIADFLIFKEESRILELTKNYQKEKTGYIIQINDLKNKIEYLEKKFDEDKIRLNNEIRNLKNEKKEIESELKEILQKRNENEIKQQNILEKEINNYEKKINDMINNFNQNMQNIEIEFNEKLSKIFSEKEKLEEELQIIKNEKEKLIQEAFEKNKQKEIQESEKENLIFKRSEEISNIKNSKNKLETKIFELENCLLKKEKIIEEKNEVFEKLNNDYLNSNLERDFLIKKFSEEKMEIQSDMIILQTNFNSLNEEYELLQSLLKKTIENYESDLTKLKKNIQNQSDSECKLKNNFEIELYNQTQELREMVKNLKIENNKLEKENSRSKNILETTQTDLSNKNKIIQNLKEKEKNFFSNTTEKKNEIEEMKNLNERLTHSLKQSEEEIKKKEKSLEQIKEKLVSIEVYYKTLLQNGEDYQKKNDQKYISFKSKNENEKFMLETDLKSKINKIDSLEIKIANLKEIIENYENNLLSKNREINDFKQQTFLTSQRMKDLEDQLNELNKSKIYNEISLKDNQDVLKVRYEKEIEDIEKGFKDKIEKLNLKLNETYTENKKFKFQNENLKMENDKLKIDFENYQKNQEKENDEIFKEYHQMSQKINLDTKEKIDFENELKNTKELYNKKICDLKTTYEDRIKTHQEEITILHNEIKKIKLLKEDFEEKNEIINEEKQVKEINFRLMLDNQKEKIEELEKDIINKEKLVEKVEKEKNDEIKKLQNCEIKLEELKADFKKNEEELKKFKNHFDQNLSIWEAIKKQKETIEEENFKLQLLCEGASKKNEDLIDLNNNLYLKVFQLRLLATKLDNQIKK